MLSVKHFIERCREFVRQAVPDRRELAFIRHNKETWRENRSSMAEGEILLEVNPMASSIIAYSYLANMLAHMHQSSVTGYLLKKKNYRSRPVDYNLQRIYKSFNTHRFIYLDLNPIQIQERDRLFQWIYSRLHSKRDVEDLSVEGVWFGDLLYDSHLMTCQVPTIDLQDERFAESLRDAVGYYIFWRDYLQSHKVKAVVLSHCVYFQAILLRIAVRQDIPVYQCGASHLYRLNKDRLWAYDDFYDYPEQFRKLSQEQQEQGLKTARERLQMRFSGEVGVDMHYSSMSSYTRPGSVRIIPESPRIKILIATHCFFDSPHPYGVNLFPDFYEWLTFLGMISEKTDYDWYIKTHPDFLPGNIEILENFLKRFPKFNLIPADSSHLQLINEGIDFALTVYGTIGFEYAALGKPVINASLCNPHIRYNFNVHPRTVEEYEGILMNLPQQTLEIDVRKVYEYYYMAHLHHTDNWLFEDFKGLLKAIGGYNEQFAPIIYEKFLEEFSGKRHEIIREALLDFIISEEYLFADNDALNIGRVETGMH
jgi:hypothetical protein